jgi:hypothetical protein
MVEKKTWREFRKSGLLFFINQILHVFGWAIVIDFESYEKNTDDGIIKEVYPARVKFRGFDEKSIDEGYKKVTHYLKENIDNLINDLDD